MTRVFSPQAQLRAMMRFEWALTCALEKHGLAEPESASVLESLLDASFVDVDSLQREARDAGNIAIPFVRQLTAVVKARDERASRAIHLGATSQDVLDTALVLQMRDALNLLNDAIGRLDRAMIRQVRAHRDTLLTGRTWLQPGPPTTLGLKLAGTLAALRRHRDRIDAAAQRALVLQFGGAVGTLASLGASGATVSAELAQILGLREPDLPWHTQRDNLVEIVQVLAVLTGSLAKFARDIALLMQAEVSGHDHEHLQKAPADRGPERSKVDGCHAIERERPHPQHAHQGGPKNIRARGTEGSPTPVLEQQVQAVNDVGNKTAGQPDRPNSVSGAQFRGSQADRFLRDVLPESERVIEHGRHDSAEYGQQDCGKIILARGRRGHAGLSASLS